jgi:phospholipid/cholesterol/gamma-HCH transport system substrate-binding protein
METRANFILIGLFTITGLLTGLGFFIWLARAEFDRQYAYYDVLFDSVAGLGTAAEVTFNGLAVGQVVDLSLYDGDASRIRVRIEIDADTPINSATVAQLQAQGVTGVSIVSLQSGPSDAPPIEEISRAGAPIIPSERSALQALTEDAPDIVTEVAALLEDLRGFVRPENQDYVTRILNSLESAAGQLELALEDFSTISQNVSEGVSQISEFTGRLEAIGEAVEDTLRAADETLIVVRSAVTEAEVTLGAGTEALTAATGSFAAAEAVFADAQVFLAEELPRLSQDLSETIATVNASIDEVRAEVTAVVRGFGGTGALATARLTEMEETIAQLDQTLVDAQETMAAVESASVSFESLVDGEGAALVADARSTLTAFDATLATLDRIATEDVAAIVTEVRGAVETANRVIDQVGGDITGFTGRLEPLVETGELALIGATQTLRDTSRTLARLEAGLDVAERTLAAAEQTFVGATAVLDVDLGPALADIRSAAAQLEASMSEATADIPEITEGLRVTVARALEVVERVDAAIAAGAPAVQDFATTGLGSFTLFARQGQDLLARMERLVQRVERDPTRFFFGGNPSEFRR